MNPQKARHFGKTAPGHARLLFRRHGPQNPRFGTNRAATRAEPCTLVGDLGPELRKPQASAQLSPCLPKSTYFLTEWSEEARVKGLGWTAPHGPLLPAPASAASPRRTGRLPAARRRARSRSYPASLNARRFPQIKRIQTCPQSKPCPLFHCGVRLGGAARGKRGSLPGRQKPFPAGVPAAATFHLAFSVLSKDPVSPPTCTF